MTFKITRGQFLPAKPLMASLTALMMAGTMFGFAAPAALAEDATPAPAAEAPAADAAAPAADATAPAAEAPTPTPDTVVATVGGDTITEADIAFAGEDLSSDLAQVPAAQRRAFLVSVLIDMKLMAKAAREAGMDQTDLFKRRLNYLEESALRRAYFGDKIANEITEESLRADYATFVANFKPEEEAHARHILVATKEEADAVEADLKAGKPFEVVAMEKTIDPSGKTNGGDLGFFTKEQMVPEFADAAFALEPGQISEPVQSQFGWHVIKLEEKKMSEPPPFEQVAQQLGQNAMAKLFNETLAGLRTSNPVDIPDPALAAAVSQEAAPAEGAAQ